MGLKKNHHTQTSFLVSYNQWTLLPTIQIICSNAPSPSFLQLQLIYIHRYDISISPCIFVRVFLVGRLGILRSLRVWLVVHPHLFWCVEGLRDQKNRLSSSKRRPPKMTKPRTPVEIQLWLAMVYHGIANVIALCAYSFQVVMSPLLYGMAVCIYATTRTVLAKEQTH